jgi:hypothetical protein
MRFKIGDRVIETKGIDDYTGTIKHIDEGRDINGTLQIRLNIDRDDGRKGGGFDGLWQCYQKKDGTFGCDCQDGILKLLEKGKIEKLKEKLIGGENDV